MWQFVAKNISPDNNEYLTGGDQVRITQEKMTDEIGRASYFFLIPKIIGKYVRVKKKKK